MHGSGQSSADRVTAGGHFARHVDELFASPDYRPPRLPTVAMQILELSRRPEVTVAEVVALLESDPLIAGRTLRIVRSPIYAGRSSIRSLRQAVIRLGLNTMRDIVLEDAMNMRVFRSEPHSAWMEQVRRHSVLTGHCARHVAKTTQACGEYAFLCGLLHDIGMAAILIAAAEHPESASHDDVLRAMGSRHARVSGELARLWQMPSEITRVVKTHHTPPRRGDATFVETVSVVCLAEELANQAGVPALPVPGAGIDESEEAALDTARDHLGITSEMWSGMVQSAEQLRDQAGFGVANAA